MHRIVALLICISFPSTSFAISHAAVIGMTTTGVLASGVLAGLSIYGAAAYPQCDVPDCGANETTLCCDIVYGRPTFLSTQVLGVASSCVAVNPKNESTCSELVSLCSRKWYCSKNDGGRESKRVQCEIPGGCGARSGAIIGSWLFTFSMVGLGIATCLVVAEKNGWAGNAP